MGERARSRTRSQWSYEPYASGGASATTAGKLAAQAWLRSRALTPPALTPWHVEIALDVRDVPATFDCDERKDTRFRIEIYSEEWGAFLCHLGKVSWIRVTDIPFVHGRDDFGLLSVMPALKDIGSLVRSIERQHKVMFKREHALVRTNIQNAEPAVRAWVRGL